MSGIVALDFIDFFPDPFRRGIRCYGADIERPRVPLATPADPTSFCSGTFKSDEVGFIGISSKYTPSLPLFFMCSFYNRGSTTVLEFSVDWQMSLE